MLTNNKCVVCERSTNSLSEFPKYLERKKLYITNNYGEIHSVKGDIEFRKILDEILREWYDLEFKDIVDILNEIGIKSKRYKLILLKEECTDLELMVKTNNERIKVILFKEIIMYPYPICKVFRKGKNTEIYALQKKLKVKKIN